jgi:1-acyl-sn-glycerol-3-phosphate acyltransferase
VVCADAPDGRASPGLRLALANLKLWARYFRFEVEGFSILGAAQPSLIVAYHGGPWTFDMFMLGARMYEKLGYFPHGVWHRAWFRFPGLRQVVTELGALDGPPSEAQMSAIKARGEHLVVAPGGAHEGLRPFWKMHCVDFAHHRGYLRLARAHGLPIIPVVSTGQEETFIGLSERFALPRLASRGEAPGWLALGLGGPWPFALPFPTKIRQRIGTPIDLADLSPHADDDAFVESANEHVTGILQSMLDELLREHPPCLRAPLPLWR